MGEAFLKTIKFLHRQSYTGGKKPNHFARDLVRHFAGDLVRLPVLFSTGVYFCPLTKASILFQSAKA